jgi:DNA-binding transcriptional regulator YdaS (Cro superfamily)
MDLRTLWLSMSFDARQTFAERCGTSFGHLRNVVYGKPCAEKLAIAIDRETQGAIRCEDLRPDVDWAYLRFNPVSVGGKPA